MTHRVLLAMFGQNERCQQEHCRFHPSGDPDPSPEDVQMTRDAAQVARLLNIDLLDHVVLGQGRFISLKEQGAL